MTGTARLASSTCTTGSPSGHDALAYWSTLRLADVDGDGRDDACMRTREGFRCALAGAHGLGGALWIGPAMRSEDGWDRVEVFSTLRMGDVDGDGRSDACAREPDGARCWLSDGRALSRVVLGPRLSDDAGWGEPARFRSIRLADVSGDGRADLCARGSAGWQCSLANGHGFDETWIVPAWGDAQSEMSADEALAGIRVGGGAGAWRDPSMSGGLSCRITPSGDSAPHGALFSGVLLVLVLALRRYRHM